MPLSAQTYGQQVEAAQVVGQRVRRFNADYFIKHQTSDRTLHQRSRTVTDNCVVDELTISFTHDTEIPWILPGVAPIGRRVVVPIVTLRRDTPLARWGVAL